MEFRGRGEVLVESRKKYDCIVPSPEFGVLRRQGGVAVGSKNRMSESTIELTEFRLHESDTGSPDVQIALLTQRINHLTQHMLDHGKDFSSRRGLLRMVARRRKLLDYLAGKDSERYQKLLTSLKLRR